MRCVHESQVIVGSCGLPVLASFETKKRLGKWGELFFEM